MPKLLPFPPRPIRRESACEIVGILAEAMAYKEPEGRNRMSASVVPSKEEVAAIAALYTQIGDQTVRQAVLDVMAAVGAAR